MNQNQGYPQGYQQAPAQQVQYVYVYDQTWQPPQVQATVDANGNYVYNYDPVHTQVSYIGVDQWNQIENDKSQYSYLWEKGEFTPQKFAEIQKRDEWTDKCWFFAFWINFVITLVFMIVICSVNMDKGSSSSSSSSSLIAVAHSISNSGNTSLEEDVINAVGDPMRDLKNTLLKAVGIGIGIGLGLTILHFLYMGFAPRFYIKFGIWVGVIFVVLICLIIAFALKEVRIPMICIAIFILLLALCIYCCCLKEFVEFTCMCFERTVQIERNHPMIFVVIFIQLIIELISNMIYSFAIMFIFINQWNYFIYIYYLFSYYWVIITNYYVFYLISANLAACCYFLEGTEYFPENALWHSVKRSLTKTFGSAAFAGFIAAIMTTLEHIAENFMKSDNKALQIIGCIAYCILCILQSIFHHVSRYGLFYVTVYNIPFLEGARRFTEITIKKFITTFMSEAILDLACKTNSIIFGIIAIALGIWIGWYSFKDLMDKEEPLKAIFALIFYPLFVIMFTEVFLWCLLNPADTITYALFICFSEYPERLKLVNNYAYEQYCYHYSCSTARATKNELPQRPSSIA